MRPTEEQLREIYRQGPDAVVALFNELFDRADAQDARIVALESNVGATSKNSSTPPSQDPFRNTARKKRRRRRRSDHHRSGGRELRPSSEVDVVVDLRPARCACCGLPLHPASQHVGTPSRYQQTEIPEPTSVLTERRRHALRCGGCGGVTKAPVPGDALERFGPRLQAAIATLSADKRQTVRQLQQLLLDFYGVTISTGQIGAVAQRIGGLCEPAAEALHAEILREDAIFGDETSWRLKDARGAWRRAWLWGVFSRDAAYYEIQPSRSGLVAETLIPVAYRGIVHTDNYGGYNHIADERHQLCWAHFARHFQRHADARDGPAREFGVQGLRICERVFKLSKQSTARQRKRLVADLDALVEVGVADDETRTMATTLKSRHGCLWHCLYLDNVDATNNHAERMIRPAVIKRKLSIGSGSAAGARATAALLSVVTTARLRGQSPYAFIESTVRAAKTGQLAPQMA
jgi:transposase